MTRGTSEDHYKQVAEELQSGVYDQDLWDRAYHESDGDETRALFKYKMLRVKRLSGNEETEEAPLNTIANQEMEAEPPKSQLAARI